MVFLKFYFLPKSVVLVKTIQPIIITIIIILFHHVKNYHLLYVNYLIFIKKNLNVIYYLYFKQVTILM